MDLDQLSQEIIDDEGMETKLYKCTADKWTIGVGRNLEDVGISKEEALFLLRNDIYRVLKQLDTRWPKYKELSENRQRVVANMVFNLGIDGFMKFKNTIAMMEAGDFEGAADGMLNSKWAAQVPNRAERLAQRMREG